MLAEEAASPTIELAEMRDPHTFSIKGIPLTYIHMLVADWGGRTTLEGLTTTEVCRRHVMPMTAHTGLSLCAQLFVAAADSMSNKVCKRTVTTVTTRFIANVTSKTTTISTTLSPYRSSCPVQDAHWFVSHAWQFRFLDVLDALDAFCDKQAIDPATTIFWMDLFSNSQHDTHKKEFKWWQTTFMNAIRRIGNVAMIMQPWDDPLPLTRCWCIFELYAASVTGSNFQVRLCCDLETPRTTPLIRLVFQVAMTHDQTARFMEEMRNDPETFFNVLATVRCEKSAAFLEADRDSIFGLVRATLGFQRLNQLVLQTFASWVITALEYEARNSDGLDQLQWLNSLGTFYNFEGRASASEEMQAQCLKAALKLCGKEHPTTIDLMISVANSDVDNGRFKEANYLLTEALNASRATNGEFHNVTINIRFMFSYLHRQEGRYDLAEASLATCFSDSESHLGELHVITCQILNLMSVLKLSQGRYDEAKKLTQECLKRRLAVFGPLHAQVVISRHNLAAVLKYQGQFAEAEEILLDCLQICRNEMSDSSVFVVIFRTALARLYHAQGRYDEAEPLLLNIYSWRKEQFGDLHSTTFPIRKDLAELEEARGNYQVAEAMLSQCLADCESTMGQYNPLTLEIWNNLGRVYLAMDRADLARDTIHACLARRREVLGELHPSTLESMAILASTLAKEGKRDEAADLLQKCYEGNLKVLGLLHPKTVEVLKALDLLLSLP
ncbi:hypothetical protein BC830DRAFT_1132112 [Chytriomyces sp. MP71]|nr:hypothetical protein BC830DRAFT_1132112 [Chytriomyces sp. MP71]